MADCFKHVPSARRVKLRCAGRWYAGGKDEQGLDLSLMRQGASGESSRIRELCGDTVYLRVWGTLQLCACFWPWQRNSFFRIKKASHKVSPWIMMMVTAAIADVLGFWALSCGRHLSNV